MPTGKVCARPKQGGFTYVLLLFAIALLGLGLIKFADTWRIDGQRDKEEELLFAGRQIRTALRSYVDQTPVGRDPLPKSIDDLLEDHRHEPPRRYLRHRYLDPFTGSTDWLPVRQGEYLLGVSSRAEIEPLKKFDFEAQESDFAFAKRYRDWQFKIEAPQSKDANSPPPGAIRPATARRAVP